MKLIKSYLTKNPCYNAGRYINVEGFVLHSVGCPQSKASVFSTSWNSPSINVAVHGFIEPGNVYVTLPYRDTKGKAMRCWGCGSPGNDMFVQFEMTEPDTINYTSGSNFTINGNIEDAKKLVIANYLTAVELFADACIFHGKHPANKNVILSHKEAHERGLGTNHGDPEHLWQGLGLPYTMDTFRQAVANKIGNIVTTIIPTTTPINIGYKYYRVGTNWTNGKCIGQIGAYTSLDNAKDVCKDGCKVFNNDGNIIYPVVKQTPVYPGYAIKYNPSKYDVNVAKIQKQLGIGSDGYFGNQTKNAVISFQAKLGLSTDGIVGPSTWGKLF